MSSEIKRAAGVAKLLQRFDYLIYIILVAILVIMPIHAFMAISLGHTIGHQAWWQAWKEAALVFGLLAALVTVTKHRQELGIMIRRPVNWAVAAYIIISLAVSLTHPDTLGSSFLFGIKTSLVFFAGFFLAQFIRLTTERENNMVTAFLAASSAVGLFAVAQVYLLPVDFLSRFGYGSATVPAFHRVDPAVSAIRIISTFSGPNQLGSFMVIPICLSLWLTLRRKWWALVPLVLSTFSLWHSYSRSAWIATAIAVPIIISLHLQSWRRWLFVLASLGLIVAGGLALDHGATNQPSNIRYFVFHGQFRSDGSQGSDKYRLSSLAQGINEVKAQPLGHGLGTAGPASYRGPKPLITENYYAQVGVESGVAGLVAFVLIAVFAAAALYHNRHRNDYAVPMLGCLLGLTICNLFLHTWADSATALTFWILAGLAMREVTT